VSGFDGEETSGVSKTKAAAFAFAACLLAGSGSAPAQEAVDVTITSYGFQDMRIEVADGICGGVLFDGSLVGDATITVNPCAGDDGTATILVANRLTGAITRYDGLRPGTNVRLR
jgi:hypothetical protein